MFAYKSFLQYIQKASLHLTTSLPHLPMIRPFASLANLQRFHSRCRQVFIMKGLRTFVTVGLSNMEVRPLVLCGPSGAGKSTLLQKLMSQFEDCFGFSVSHTTRKPRPGEEDGVHYHFVSREDMEEAIKAGKFIEFAEYSGNLYGTSKKAVETVASAYKICVLDIEIQGVKQVKESDLDPQYVFIKPPSIEELEARLRGRGTETEESLAKRLSVAKVEMEYGETEGNFDVVIVNDEEDQAYDELKDFLISDIEKLRQKK